MSIRTFIFCDTCNRQGIRYVEQQRSTSRGDHGGRRVTDGRSWFEGSLGDAVDAGWRSSPEGKQICPRCAAQRLRRPRLALVSP